MTINNIEELKALILWCKEEKVEKVTIGNISFTLSSLALIEREVDISVPNEDEKDEEVVSAETDLEDEDTLFHSSY